MIFHENLSIKNISFLSETKNFAILIFSCFFKKDIMIGITKHSDLYNFEKFSAGKIKSKSIFLAFTSS